MARIHWPAVLDQARAIVAEYDTAVTLRQLFYRLVAAEVLPNTQTAYKTLSDRTAAARRADDFPDLVDNNRSIHEPMTFAESGRRARLAAGDLPPRSLRAHGRVRVSRR